MTNIISVSRNAMILLVLIGTAEVASAQNSDEKIRALVTTITTEKSEYEVIPQIWEIALVDGKANDAARIKRLLKLAIPQPDTKLQDWQAVVLGGSIINGLSQSGVWPKQRLDELMKDDKELQARWKRTLELAAKMADDERVKKGTRYDALRILGADHFEKGEKQFTKYIAKGAHGELQMGAVSGLSDIDEPTATELLLSSVPGLTNPNRELAIEALLRTDERAAALLDHVHDGKLSTSVLTAKHIERLKQSKNTELQTKVQRLENSGN
jgi:hypothetical protein